MAPYVRETAVLKTEGGSIAMLLSFPNVTSVFYSVKQCLPFRAAVRGKCGQVCETAVYAVKQLQMLTALKCHEADDH